MRFHPKNIIPEDTRLEADVDCSYPDFFVSRNIYNFNPIVGKKHALPKKSV
jgi:hypothetical protein